MRRGRVTGTVASLVFAAATMNWFRTRCTWWRSALLLLATFLFFRPDSVMDRFAPKYVSAPAAEIYKVADTLGEDDWLVVGIAGREPAKARRRPRPWRCRWARARTAASGCATAA